MAAKVKPCALVIPLLLAAGCSASAQTFDPRDPRSPLQLVRTIALRDVRGRIDHMALDTRSNHLFVAELGNGSVDDVDLASGTVAGRIPGLHEPQGVAWLPAQDEIAVACGDGSVHFYRTADRREVARIRLGDDADNVRIDPRNGELVVGYGSGALAIVDPATHSVLRQVKLPAHPEAFEIVGSRAYVNVPDAHRIVVADIDRGAILSTIGTGLSFGNFPMASDPGGVRIAIAYRAPASLSVIDTRSNAAIFSKAICGDADDLYVRSARIVVVCGSGAVDLVDDSPAHREVRVATAPGARTGLLDSGGSHLFVAAPAREGQAAIWDFRFR